MVQDAFAEFHRRFIATTGTDEDSDQFSIRQGPPALSAELFTWPIGLGPGFDTYFGFVRQDPIF